MNTTTKIKTRTRKPAPPAIVLDGGTTEHAPAVMLDLGSGDVHADAAPVWIQIAKPGSFKGHAAGAFDLDAKCFAEIVHNFNRTQNRRIPVDFEHASEQPATDGSIPALGAPAQGWITKLDVRSDGLWGLCSWGALAREYIRSGKYRFLSPAIVFGAKDRVTGKPIGARLSSVALTNNPFLDGMAPVTAKDAPPKAPTGPKGAPPATAPKGPNAAKPNALDGDGTEDADTQGEDEDGAELSEDAATCTRCAELSDTIARLESENQELRAKLAEHDERELTRMVAGAKRRGAPQSETILMSLARSNPEAFAAAWPPIDPYSGPSGRLVAMGPTSTRRDASEQTIAMTNAGPEAKAAAPPLPEIDHFVREVEADAKAKGIEVSREVVYVRAHELRADAAERLRREAGTA